MKKRWLAPKGVTQKKQQLQVKPESFQLGLPDICQALQPNLFVAMVMSIVLKSHAIPLLFLKMSCIYITIT